MNRIVIVGNGFDRAHGLKTSYGDFIKYIIEESIRGNEEIREHIINVGGLFHEEQSFDNIKKLIKAQKTGNKITFSNLFFRDLLNKYFEADWVDIESFYFTRLSLTSESVVKKLNQEFEEIKTQLELYLLKQKLPPNFKPLTEYHRIFKEGNPKSLLLLNFNYTPTLQPYLKNILVRDKSVINIHGELTSMSNPLIFGYGDDTDNRYIEIKNKNDNDYLENLKRQQYNSANPYSELLTFLRRSVAIEVLVMGHSLGLSDKTLLNQILDHEKVTKIKLFHRKGLPGYNKLSYNLSRIVSSKTYNSGKIVNFPNSSPMPQVPKTSSK